MVYKILSYPFRETQKEHVNAFLSVRALLLKYGLLFPLQSHVDWVTHHQDRVDHEERPHRDLTTLLCETIHHDLDSIQGVGLPERVVSTISGIRNILDRLSEATIPANRALITLSQHIPYIAREYHDFIEKNLEEAVDTPKQIERMARAVLFYEEWHRTLLSFGPDFWQSPSTLRASKFAIFQSILGALEPELKTQSVKAVLLRVLHTDPDISALAASLNRYRKQMIKAIATLEKSYFQKMDSLDRIKDIGSALYTRTPTISLMRTLNHIYNHEFGTHLPTEDLNLTADIFGGAILAGEMWISGGPSASYSMIKSISDYLSEYAIDLPAYATEAEPAFIRFFGSSDLDLPDFLKLDEVGIAEKRVLFQLLAGLALVMMTNPYAILPATFAYGVTMGGMAGLEAGLRWALTQTGVEKDTAAHWSSITSIIFYPLFYKEAFNLGIKLFPSSFESSTSMTIKDAYDVLGIPMDSNWSVIQRAYREAMKTHHTDKGGHQEKAVLLNLAKEVLQRSFQPHYKQD